MSPNTSEMPTIDDIEIMLNTEKSIDRLLYQIFITLNPKASEYNQKVPMEQLLNEGKYQVVREIFQQKILSVKKEIKADSPPLIKLDEEFGNELEKSFESICFDLTLNYDSKLYQFNRDKITSLAVKAEEFGTQNHTYYYKAIAWSLISEANYLTGLLIADNLNKKIMELKNHINIRNEEIKRLNEILNNVADTWEGEINLCTDIINTASNFIVNVSSDLTDQEIMPGSGLDSFRANYLAQIDMLSQYLNNFRIIVKELKDKKNATSESRSENRDDGINNREKLKIEFIELLKNKRNHPWNSIDDVVTKTLQPLIKIKKKYSPNAKRIPNKDTIVRLIANKNGNDKYIFDIFIVNYIGALPLKTAMIVHLIEQCPSIGWDDVDAAVESFKKAPKTDELLHHMLPIEMRGEKYSKYIDLKKCFHAWLISDKVFSKAFSGKLSQKK